MRNLGEFCRLWRNAGNYCYMLRVCIYPLGWVCVAIMLRDDNAGGGGVVMSVSEHC